MRHSLLPSLQARLQFETKTRRTRKNPAPPPPLRCLWAFP